MQVLLTGGTGFIGQEVLKRLLAQNDTVRILVRSETLERSESVQRLIRQDGVEVVPGTLTNAEVVMRAHQGVEIVYHLAWHWRRHGSKSETQRDEQANQVNRQIAEYVLKACARHKVRRLVYTSSVSVYGPAFNRAKWPLTEETPLYKGSHGGHVLRNYIHPKIAIEDRVRQVAQQSAFEYVILRPSIVYGTGWHGQEWLMEQVVRSRGRSWPNGYQMGLQMVHVRDLAEACVLAGVRAEAAGREFNIAGSEVATIEELSQMINGTGFGALGRQPKLGLKWAREYQRYDTSKAQMFLGFTPQVALRDGVAALAAAGPDLPDGTSRLSHQAALVGQLYDWQLDFSVLDDYYDHSDFLNWGYWDAKATNQRKSCENLMEKLLAFIPKKRGRILDVACGKGATTRHLLKYYKPENVTGINVTEKQLEICRKNARGCTFLLMDATKLKFGDNSFDNIICVEAAGHFDTRDEFLREAHRVLKPGGRLVLSDAVFSTRSWLPHRQRALRWANYIRDTGEYRKVCLQAGFAEVVTMDATEESWGGFSENLRAYLKDSLFGGTMDERTYAMVTSQLDRMASTFSFYVIASCLKR